MRLGIRLPLEDSNGAAVLSSEASRSLILFGWSNYDFFDIRASLSVSIHFCLCLFYTLSQFLTPKYRPFLAFR